MTDLVAWGVLVLALGALTGHSWRVSREIAKDRSDLREAASAAEEALAATRSLYAADLASASEFQERVAAASSEYSQTFRTRGPIDLSLPDEGAHGASWLPLHATRPGSSVARYLEAADAASDGSANSEKLYRALFLRGGWGAQGMIAAASSFQASDGDALSLYLVSLDHDEGFPAVSRVDWQWVLEIATHSGFEGERARRRGAHWDHRQDEVDRKFDELVGRMQ